MVDDSPICTTKIYSRSIIFQYFLKDIYWFVEKTDICNFVDDNTIYSRDKPVNDVIDNLQFELKIA